MKISTKGRYALRTMLDLAMHDEGTLIPLKDISSRQGITIKYLEQVMNLLSKAGYVRSVRGSRGRLPPGKSTICLYGRGYSSDSRGKSGADCLFGG